MTKITKKDIKELCKWLITNEDGIEMPEYFTTLGGMIIIGLPALIVVATALGGIWSKVKTQIDKL